MHVLLFYASSSLVMLSLSTMASEAPQHWWDNGMKDIETAMNRMPNYNVPKNQILMIGDGMGLSTITAGRIYTGQQTGSSGEEYQFTFEKFPNVALSKTYNVDRQVADSAGTAAAMASGYKTNYGTLGFNSEVPNVENCAAVTEEKKLTTILDYALQEGKSVGLVTSTRVTHATPSAFYAHTPWRYWEYDAAMQNISGCDAVSDIAYQLIMENPNIQVVLGGGKRSFVNTTAGGRRLRNDLVEEWKKDKARRTPAVNYQYVENAGQFRQVNGKNMDYLFGLFTSNNMNYEIDRNDNEEPSLSEMTEKAVEILSRNPKGFFLMVESGRIDHAHHENLGKKSLHDMLEFNNAVKKVTDMTSESDTLVIVTADHSHVFTMAGYPSRGNDILGIVDIVTPDETPPDGKPYLTLGYANGPSAHADASARVDYTNVDTHDPEFVQQACVQMAYETHGGEDVAIYAEGPMAHLFHSTHEQSYVGHVLLYSACMGKYKNNCDLDKRMRMMDTTPCGAGKSGYSLAILSLTVMTLIACVLF